jgi:hypothetical protein
VRKSKNKKVVTGMSRNPWSRLELMSVFLALSLDGVAQELFFISFFALGLGELCV